MKKRLFTITVCVLVALISMFSASCGGADLTKVSGVKKAYDASMKTVRTVVTSVEYKDKSFVIKSVKRTQAFISDTEATVTTETTAIDPSTFEESTKTDSAIVALNRKDLVVFNFKKNVMDNFSSQSGVITANIADENVSAFIGDIPVFGGLTFEAEFDGEQIKSASYSFKFITDEKTGKICEAFVTTTYVY